MFKRAQKRMGFGGKVIAADLSDMAAACYVADHHVKMPPVSSSGYLDAIAETCARYNVALIFSLIDTDQCLLAENRALLELAGGKLIVSGPVTNAVSADKRETARFFSAHGISTPRTYDVAEQAKVVQEGHSLILKPWNGSRSESVYRVNSIRELKFFRDYVPHAMVQEFLTGDEYTVDVYVDFAGEVRCAVPRKRLEVRSGEVSKGVTVRDEAVIEGAIWIAKCLPDALGCLTIQCFKAPDGTVSFTEINPRFGGGFPLSAHAGADFPLWFLQEAHGVPCDASMDAWKEGVLMSRYDAEIIISS